jgi:deazaflavin-dependent oxidoreductase (nitroreductase family)
MANFNSPVIEEFRANGGKVGGMFAGMQLLLLTATGAKSGNAITVPVAYSKDGNNFVIVASKGGAPSNPDWYHNLVAHPEVAIEVGTDKFPVKAQETTGDERERLFDQHAKAYPQFNEYKTKTSRVIPVFVLERI